MDCSGAQEEFSGDLCCGLVSPSATSPSTSTSRGVSSAGCSRAEGGGCSGAGDVVEDSSSENALQVNF